MGEMRFFIDESGWKRYNCPVERIGNRLKPKDTPKEVLVLWKRKMRESP